MESNGREVWKVYLVVESGKWVEAGRAYGLEGSRAMVATFRGRGYTGSWIAKYRRTEVAL